MRVDLHTHTSASDGALAPAALCERAVARGVDLLAITDHDTCAGYFAALAAQPALRVLPAAEFSAQWRNMGVHVVGLAIDPAHSSALAAFDMLQGARRQRAEIIGERLARLGMPGACEGALTLAGESQVGRPHFARFLVEQGYVGSENDAFDRWLGSGKPGDVKALWPSLEQVVAWVTEASGVAVLAHPLKYKLTATRLRLLVTEFAAAGGTALEVVAGRQLPDATRQLAGLCAQFGMEASVGSDFHAPGQYWSDLGDIAPLPAECEPVWRRWMA